MSRDLKYHHRERLKKNRRFYWSRDRLKEPVSGVVINTPKPCGCWMCSNKRKNMGLGMQERRERSRVDDMYN